MEGEKSNTEVIAMGNFNLVPFDAFKELLDEEATLLDRFFTRGLSKGGAFRRFLGDTFKFPAIELKDDKEEIVVKAELPGIDKKNIKIDIEKNNLTIKGETKKEQEVKKEGYSYTERTYGSFYRTIPLSAAVQKEKASASYKDGILTVVLPKDKNAKSKDSEIQIQ